MGHPPPRDHGPEPLWAKALRTLGMAVYGLFPALVVVAFLWLAATWWTS